MSGGPRWDGEEGQKEQLGGGGGGGGGQLHSHSSSFGPAPKSNLFTSLSNISDAQRHDNQTQTEPSGPAAVKLLFSPLVVEAVGLMGL